MVSRVQHKRSSVAGNVPGPSDIEIGELAINFADRYIYTKNGASAVIRLTGAFPLVQPTNEVAGDSYIDPATGKLYSYFSLNANPIDWHEIAPPEDLTPFVKHDGSISMTGQLSLIGSATGSEAVSYDQVVSMIGGDLDDYLKKDGTVAMTGRLTLSADPTNPLHAATKDYVDTAVSIATPDLTAYLAKVGGVMTGQITLPGGGTGNQAATANELAAGFAAHIALPDPHTQYATNVELNNHIATGASQHPAVTGAANGFMIAADKTRLDTMTVAADADVTAGTDNAKYLTSLRLSTWINPLLRRKLTANRTLFVRADGSDSNDGSANTSGSAFLTITKAVSVAQGLDINGFVLTIKVNNGTYTAAIIIPAMVGALNADKFVIEGDTATPGNVIISVTSNNCFTANEGVMVTIKGFDLRTITDGACISATNGAVVKYSNMIFGASAQQHITASYHAVVRATSSYTINGNATSHLMAFANGMVSASNIVITLSGTRAFNFWAVAAEAGIVYTNGTTFVGTATGNRGSATLGGGIGTGGTTQPGSTGPTTTAPGWAY